MAHSFAEWARLTGKELLICFSKVDHPAVATLAERYFGPHVKFFELKRDKELRYLHSENAEALKDKRDNNPELLILYHHLWVHNETGQVSPLNELKILKTISDLYIHVDAVQAPAKIADWNELSLGDAWTFSGHKFGAMKGVGFTFLNKNLPFHPLISGGGQQQGQRSGTENTMGVKSVELALLALKSVDISRTQKVKSALETFLKEELKGIGQVLSTSLPQNSNTIYFYFNKVASDVALALFDLNGLEISTGSACSSGAAKDSVVLLQMGLKDVAKNGLRLSIAYDVDPGILSEYQERLKKVLSKLKA